jgi:cysteine desulfurase family protein
MTTHRRVYLDNAATSYPKPPAVAKAMLRFSTQIGASPGRGAYAESATASQALVDTRMALASLLLEPDPSRIAFTLNCTDALSLAIYGIAKHWRRAKSPVHMVTTAMDHNSVLRPLNDLAGDGVTTTCVAASPDTGRIEPDDIAAALTPLTKLVCVVHGSNVSGTVQDIEAIAERCNDANVPLLVDAAQTAGHRMLHPQEMGINLLAVPGHKGLLGPLGTGALWLGQGMESLVEPVRTGGTGSRSEDDVHPDELPDRYEAGSHNTVGLVGLGAALGTLDDASIAAIETRESALSEQLLEGLLAIDGLRVLGPQTNHARCGVFSMTTPNCTSDAFSRQLEADHGVLSRPGIHCAPLAHQTFGTLATGGATRLSIGHATTAEDVEQAIDAVRAVHTRTVTGRAAILVP